MKSFISGDKNLYYEAPDRLNQNDIEVPRRPSSDHTFANGVWLNRNEILATPFQTLPVNYQQITANQSNLSDLVNVIKQLQTLNNAGQTTVSLEPNIVTAKKENRAPTFIGDSFTWKDLITILYFAGGIVGLWMHMNERIIVLEQKVVTIEKGNMELQASFKEFIIKNENQLKGIDGKISDLQQLVISRISQK